MRTMSLNRALKIIFPDSIAKRSEFRKSIIGCFCLDDGRSRVGLLEAEEQPPIGGRKDRHFMRYVRDIVKSEDSLMVIFEGADDVDYFDSFHAIFEEAEGERRRIPLSIARLAE